MAATVRIAYSSGKSRENQRLTHHVVTVADGGDRPLAQTLCLIYRSREVHHADQQTGNEDKRRLHQQSEPSRPFCTRKKQTKP